MPEYDGWLHAWEGFVPRNGDNVFTQDSPSQEGLHYNEMSRKSAYQEHLASSYWKAVRKLAMERDGNRCVLCNSPSDLVVHRRTYKNVGNEAENLGDLSTLCRPCHEAHHAAKDAKRKANRKPRRKKKPASPLYLADFLDGKLREI